MDFAIVIISWLHIALVVLWLGGAAFISLILPRTLSNMLPDEQKKINKRIRSVFVPLAWIYIVLLAISGIIRLNIVTSDVISLVSLDSSYGQTLFIKLGVFVLIIILSVLITWKFRQLASISSPEEGQAIIKTTRLLSSINIVLGFVIVLIATGLAEGGLF